MEAARIEQDSDQSPSILSRHIDEWLAPYPGMMCDPYFDPFIDLLG